MVDTFQECFVGVHLTVVLAAGLPVLLFVCVGFPIGFVVWLRRHRAELGKREFAEKWDILYATYTREHAYWEAVVMLRKMALFSLVTFFSDSAPATQVRAHRHVHFPYAPHATLWLSECDARAHGDVHSRMRSHVAIRIPVCAPHAANVFVECGRERAW